MLVVCEGWVEGRAFCYEIYRHRGPFYVQPVQHIVCLVVELEDFPFGQIFVSAHINMFFRLLLLHWLLHGGFGFRHHGSRLLLLLRFRLVADPGILLFIDILDGILEILLFELSELIEFLIFFLHLALNFLRFFLHLLNSDLFDLPVSFLSFDDFGIALYHVQFAVVHCCYVVVN